MCMLRRMVVIRDELESRKFLTVGLWPTRDRGCFIYFFVKCNQKEEKKKLFPFNKRLVGAE